MKYFDKNYIKWQQRQRVKEDPHYRSNRELRRNLDRFCISHIEDKDWWRILSWDERDKVYNSYHNTLDHFKRSNDDRDSYWYSYDPDIADVTGKTWEECVPQWLKYVQDKYPLDANVRRELAIRRIFS